MADYNKLKSFDALNPGESVACQADPVPNYLGYPNSNAIGVTRTPEGELRAFQDVDVPMLSPESKLSIHASTPLKSDDSHVDIQIDTEKVPTSMGATLDTFLGIQGGKGTLDSKELSGRMRKQVMDWCAPKMM